MSTTQDKIKEMFLRGDVLTSCGAAEQFITADLRKYVSNLRKQGLDIVGKRVTSTAGKSYKEYRLRIEEKKEDDVSVPVISPPPVEVKVPEPSIERKPFSQQQIQF